MTKQGQIEEISKIVDEMYNVYTTTAEDIAEGIYQAGYRKIDENCAVITKAELKQYKVQAVKEFAEKVKMAFYYEFDEIIPSIMSDKIDELLKELE